MGRVSRMTERATKKGAGNITVPIVDPEKEKEAKNPNVDDVDRTIERLRVEFAARERKKRAEERATREKEKEKQNKAAEMKAREMSRKAGNYTMDISGARIPMIQFPIQKCREMVDVIRAKVNENSVIDTSANYSEFLLEKQQKAEAEKANNESPNNQNDADLNKSQYNSVKSRPESEDYRVADLSRIEPSFGVTLKGNAGIKKGPSVMEDPKIMAKTTFGFHKGKSGGLGRRADARRIVIAQEREKVTSKTENKGKHNEISKIEPIEQNDVSESVLDPQSLLVQNNQADLAYFHNKKDANKTFYGAVPTGAASYAKYRRGISISSPYKQNLKSDAKVIASRDELAKNMEFVEENAITRLKTAAGKRNESTVLRKTGSIIEHRTKNRGSLNTSYTKLRMAPPPIGKTVGHGIIRQRKL